MKMTVWLRGFGEQSYVGMSGSLAWSQFLSQWLCLPKMVKCGWHLSVAVRNVVVSRVQRAPVCMCAGCGQSRFRFKESVQLEGSLKSWPVGPVGWLSE